MRLPVSRRAALVAGVATVAAVALAGCSAGQVAETALKKPSNMGVNADTTDGSVAIRNLSVVYAGPAGYPAGGNAPLEVAMFNQTDAEIVVTVTSRPAEGTTPEQGVVSGTMVGLVGGVSAPAATATAETPANVEPSAGAPSEPAEPAAEPARITLTARGYASFLPDDAEQLQVMGLTDRLVPGMSVNLVFEFSNGATALTLLAPVGVPTVAGLTRAGQRGGEPRARVSRVLSHPAASLSG